MLHAVDHVSIAVRDLAQATRRCALLLGRRPSWQGERPAEGTANALFRLENTSLELVAPAGRGRAEAVLRRRLDEGGEGLLALALATRDALACHAELARRGLAPEPVGVGLERDGDSGAFREWRRIALPPSRTRGVLLSVVEPLSPGDLLPPATLLGDARAAVSGLDHAVVQTPDPDAAASLYGEGLGLRLALDRRFPEWGVRLLFFRIGGVTIELAAPLGAAPDVPTTDVLWGLSWRVPDADAARARLAARGVDVSEVRPGRKPGTRVTSVRDGTCGVPTLLLEPGADARMEPREIP